MTAVIHYERPIVDRRLQQYFNSTRSQWIEIVAAAIAARARATDDSPISSAGYYAWAAATTRARQMFRREGWIKGYENGVETIDHRELKKKVAVMNTDEGTCDKDRSPLNRTVKGPATERIVDLNNQFELFKRDVKLAPVKEPPYPLWYLCIYDGQGKVRAEISKPSEFAGGSIVKFSERIFILQDGEWDQVLLTTPASDRLQDFEINVRRK
jgi:hypothetical protein